MAYFKRYTRPSARRRGLLGLGDLSSTITTVADVTADPYFPEVVCHVQQLQQIERGQEPQECPESPDGLMGGVGLRSAMPGLRAYVEVKKHPWLLPVAIVGVLAIPFLLGVRYGRDGAIL